jgi:Activator of Hsp90 ATPase homolog 1-like protein
VWQALTEPESVKLWWGPEHFSAPAIQIDLQVGGKRTRLTLCHSDMPVGEMLDMTEAGWKTSLDKLAASLK